MGTVNQYQGQDSTIHSTGLMSYSHNEMGTQNFCGKICDDILKCKYCYYNPDNKDLSEDQKEELRKEGRRVLKIL